MDQRFRRQEALLGPAAMEKLKGSAVAVLGLGGVGSWCAEALARCGVGTLYLLDQDTVSLSNVNRQLCALESTLGRPKAEVLAERARDIAPECRAVPLVYRYGPDTREELLSLRPDYIVDAIDLVSCKVDLAVSCVGRGIPLISALGTGNKRDASLLEITDIAKTRACPLARIVRKELRRRGVVHLPVVYSPEEALEGETDETPPPGRRAVPGSLVWVPAAAGLLLCQHVVTELTKQSDPIPAAQ